MYSVEGNFSFGSRMISATVAECTGTGVEIETGFEQAGFGQALFEKVGLPAMDSDRHLRYLSQNPALKFVVMSLSSFSSQTMGGTPQSTLVSGSLLAVEKDEDGDNDETDGEGRGAYGRVLALGMD